MRFSEYGLGNTNPAIIMHDLMLDNRIIEKKDLRFHDQETAEDFAITQYMVDFIPRSVIRGASGLLMVLENPTHEEHPSETFYINSTPCEG